MHRRWLGGIYAWAGTYRQVNISKGGFPFAAANRVPALMEDYSRKVLAKRTPCRGGGRAEIASGVAGRVAAARLQADCRQGKERLLRARPGNVLP